MCTLYLFKCDTMVCCAGVWVHGLHARLSNALVVRVCGCMAVECTCGAVHFTVITVVLLCGPWPPLVGVQSVLNRLDLEGDCGQE
jgi:hypothetical protein